MKPVLPMWYRLCLVIVVCIAPILVVILIEHGAFPDGVHSWLRSKGGAVTTIVAWAILVGTVHDMIQTRRRLPVGQGAEPFGGDSQS